MAFLLLGALLALAVTGALLIALLRPAPAAPGGEVAIYEDQLAEVDRDEARGLLGSEEAAQARTEVERRLLTAARARGAAGGSGRRSRFVLALCIGGLPLAAAAIYARTGNPGLPDTDFASRMAPTPTLAQLRERLSANPDDLSGWVALGDALTAQGRRAEAAPAYAEAVRLTGGRDRRLAGAYAEALSLAEGEVTEEAETIFASIQAAHPDDPQAAYYLAQARAARGDLAGAARDLHALLSGADPAAPWYAGVRALRDELADQRGPTPAQVAAASALPGAEQATMIESMVEGLAARLAAQPDDPEGWRRLARAYGVLGETAKAEAAWREVAARVPDDAEARAALSP